MIMMIIIMRENDRQIQRRMDCNDDAEVMISLILKFLSHPCFFLLARQDHESHLLFSVSFCSENKVQGLNITTCLPVPSLIVF